VNRLTDLSQLKPNLQCYTQRQDGAAASAEPTTFTLTPYSSRIFYVTVSAPESADTSSVRNGSMNKYLRRDFIGKICRKLQHRAERKQIKGPGQKLTLGHGRFQMPLSNGDFLFLACPRWKVSESLAQSLHTLYFQSGFRLL
jgi:hypothetical protein